MTLVRKRIVLPLIPTDIFQVIRPTQNKDAVLDLTYQQLLSALSEVFSGGGSLILLQTDGVDNGNQNLLNLVAGPGVTLTDNGLGSVLITSTGGASFITSTSDTASIDLTVTSGVLTADLVDIVTAGTFGDSTHVPQITIDSKGRITGVALVAITAGAGTVTSVATAGLISGGTITTSGTITTLMSTNKLVGRGTAGSGVMEEITLGTGLSLTGNTLNATGGGGGVTSVTATAPITSSGGATPDISTSMNTNKMIGRYSVGTGVMEELSVGAGLAISGSSLIATGSASGGSSISYYLNGGTAASVLTYYQMSKTAVVGTNVDFNKSGNGLITQWLTDVGDPNRIEIPAGNWNFEIFMSASSAGGTPAFYVELLKYNGAFTTIANSSAAPENITGGTSIDLYLTSLAIPYTTLLATDRLALRFYIVNSVGGRTITMHTQDSHLCQVITNFAGGIVSINGVGANTQFLTTGTVGTDFNIDSTSTLDTHIFNLPTASSLNRGVITAAQFADITAGSFGVTVDGVTSIIQIGQTGFVTMNYAGTISGWSISANAVGSIQFDIWKATGAIPTIANTIVAGVYPTLTAAQFVTSTTMTGWTLSFVAGDVFGFYVNSISTLKNATLTVRTIKS